MYPAQIHSHVASVPGDPRTYLTPLLLEILMFSVQEMAALLPQCQQGSKTAAAPLYWI